MEPLAQFALSAREVALFGADLWRAGKGLRCEPLDSSAPHCPPFASQAADLEWGQRAGQKGRASSRLGKSCATGVVGVVFQKRAQPKKPVTQGKKVDLKLWLALSGM
jgi:hypothetical protein